MHALSSPRFYSNERPVFACPPFPLDTLQNSPCGPFEAINNSSPPYITHTHPILAQLHHHGRHSSSSHSSGSWANCGLGPSLLLSPRASPHLLHFKTWVIEKWTSLPHSSPPTPKIHPCWPPGGQRSTATWLLCHHILIDVAQNCNWMFYTFWILRFLFFTCYSSYFGDWIMSFFLQFSVLSPYRLALDNRIVSFSWINKCLISNEQLSTCRP